MDMYDRLFSIKEDYFNFLLPLKFKVIPTITPIPTQAPMEETIFPFMLYINQNIPLSNAPTMPEISNFIDVYYHLATGLHTQSC